jgi:hypothetical protein
VLTSVKTQNFELINNEIAKKVHVIQLSEVRSRLPQDSLKGVTEPMVAAGTSSEKDTELLLRGIYHWFRV